jgi:hypothetical protein
MDSQAFLQVDLRGGLMVSRLLEPGEGSRRLGGTTGSGVTLSTSCAALFFAPACPKAAHTFRADAQENRRR